MQSGEKAISPRRRNSAANLLEKQTKLSRGLVLRDSCLTGRVTSGHRQQLEEAAMEIVQEPFSSSKLQPPQRQGFPGPNLELRARASSKSPRVASDNEDSQARELEDLRAGTANLFPPLGASRSAGTSLAGSGRNSLIPSLINVSGAFQAITSQREKRAEEKYAQLVNELQNSSRLQKEVIEEIRGLRTDIRAMFQALTGSMA